MNFLREIPDQTRAYVYRVVEALIGVLIVSAGLRADEASVWLLLVAAVLGVSGGGLAVANTSTKRPVPLDEWHVEEDGVHIDHAPLPVVDYQHNAVECLVRLGYSTSVAEDAVDAYLSGETDLTNTQANCIKHVKKSLGAYDV